MFQGTRVYQDVSKLDSPVVISPRDWTRMVATMVCSSSSSSSSLLRAPNGLVVVVVVVVAAAAAGPGFCGGCRPCPERATTAVAAPFLVLRILFVDLLVGWDTHSLSGFFFFLVVVVVVVVVRQEIRSTGSQNGCFFFASSTPLSVG